MIITTYNTEPLGGDDFACTQSDHCDEPAVVAIYLLADQEWSGLAACAIHHPDRIGGVHL